MTTKRSLTWSAAALALTASTGLATAEQIRRQPGAGTGQVPMEVSLKAGGSSYAGSAPGSCTYAPVASIYGVVSEMWMARQANDSQSVQLTLWKPKDGSDQMFSIAVNGRSSLSVTTVRGQVSGSGKVALAPAEKGGTFTVDAKTKTGEAITGTIKCAAFTPAIAEGGH
jgi:hypothetical protein